MLRRCVRASGWLFNFQFVIFDDRIAQEFVRRIVQGFLRRGLVGAGGEVNFDVFTDMDAGDTGVAHVFEGGLNGFALRIKDGFLWGDDDFCFHARAGKVWGKAPLEASQKSTRPPGRRAPVNKIHPQPPIVSCENPAGLKKQS